MARARKTTKRKSAKRKLSAAQIAAGFGGKKGRKTRAKKTRARPRATKAKARKRGPAGLEARVTRLEHSGAALEGVTRAMVNKIRQHHGVKPLQKIPGYVSPLGKRAAAAAHALPASVRHSRTPASHQLGSGR